MEKKTQYDPSAFERRLVEKEFLLRLSQDIHVINDLEKALQIVSDSMSELFETDSAAIYLVESKDQIYLAASTPHVDDSYPDEFRFAKTEDHPHIKKVLDSRELLYLPDLNKVKLSDAELLIIQFGDIKSLLYFPFIFDNEVIGLIIFGASARVRKFSEYEVELGRNLADQLSLWIQNAKMRQELIKNNDELKRQIKEKKKVEAELLESKAQLSDALRLSRMGHWSYNIQNDEFIFTDEFYELFHTSAREMGGFKMSSAEYMERFIYPEDQHIIPEEVKLISENRDPNLTRYLEHRIIYTDGGVGYIAVNVRLEFDENGTPSRAVGVNQDITPRRKAEIANKEVTKSLEESEYLFRTFFNLSDEGIFLVTPDGKKFLQINDAFARMHGYQVEEMMEMTLFDLDVNGENTIKFNPQISEQIESGKVVTAEVQHLHKDGHVFSLSVMIQQLEIKNEEYLLCFHQDLTERKLYEQNLLNALEKAKESDRLKSSFLANISHEIRTPLNAILGFSKLLCGSELLEKEKNEYQSIIEFSGKRLLGIISDIIDVSKLDSNQISLNYDSCHLNELISKLIAQYRDVASNKGIDIQMRFELPEDACTIRTDKYRLSQIISNLIDNALKYTNEGSLEIGYRLQEDEVEFFVRDTGIGIDPKYHEMIFGRFMQVDNDFSRAGSGNGLGLSIVLGLVNLLGGRIWVESELSIGSVFRFTIPFQPIDDLKVSDYQSDHLMKNSKEFNILIAEDEDTNFLLLEAFLEPYRCKIYRAKNGEEAVRLFHEHRNTDLVLMDIKMPMLNGIEATKAIRKVDKSVPIIAQTAYSQSDDRDKALQAGCNHYISKPIEEDKLHFILSTIFSKSAN